MQLFANFYKKSEKLQKLITKEEYFVYLLACLCHDNSHRGKNNDYHVKIKDEMAYYFY